MDEETAAPTSGDKKLTASERMQQALLEAWGTIITWNADGTATVALDNPVDAWGEKASSLKLRRPTAKDFKRLNTKRIKAGEGDAVAEAICVLAAIPPNTFDQLSGADCEALRTVIENFFMPSRLIGEAFSRMSARS